MQILKPLGNKISEKVKSWSQIKKEAWELKDFLDAKKFKGHWTDAFSISHCQVSNEPKCFFVVNKKKIKEFGHWCVINARIVKNEQPVTFSEGCMSFMYRKEANVERYAKITVTYQTPFLNLFLIPRRRVLKEIDAFIVQHEVQHFSGKSIYFPD